MPYIEMLLFVIAILIAHTTEMETAESDFSRIESIQEIMKIFRIKFMQRT